MNDFAQKCAYSFGANQAQDIEMLKKIIPGCISVEPTPLEQDKRGVDYIATLRGGALVNIDAKRREPGCSKYWRDGEPELALEIWSVMPDSTTKGKAGWTLNEASDVDLILYSFEEQDCSYSYILPFQHLRAAFIANYTAWAKVHKPKTQRSVSGDLYWQSQAMFVPASKVLDAIKAASVINL